MRAGMHARARALARARLPHGRCVILLQLFCIRRGMSSLCTFQLDDWRIVRRSEYPEHRVP
jgi:hypothetical protein